MTLEETIALMLKNEESPAKIQEVKDAWEEKKNKKKEEAGNSNDKAVGVFAESEKETPVMGPAEETEGNTDLELEDGSSELPELSWGDTYNKFYEQDLSLPTDALAVNLPTPSEEEVVEANIILENKKSQKEDFETELNKAFDYSSYSSNGTLFGQLISNTNNFTIQEREVDNQSSPQQYLTDIVKEKLGGMGSWIFDEESELRKTKYPNLNNDEIDELIKSSFYSQLDEYNNNQSSKRAQSAVKNVIDQGGTISDWNRNQRDNIINSYSGIDNEIAAQVEVVKNAGQGTGDPLITYSGELAKLEELKAKKPGGSSMLYDLDTGDLKIKRPGKPDEEQDNIVPLGIDEKQSQINTALSELEPSSQIEYLESEFNRSALTLKGLNDEINMLQEWSVTKSATEIAADYNDGDAFNDSNRKKITMSLKDLMAQSDYYNANPIPMSDFANLQGEAPEELVNKWGAKIKTLKQDRLDYTSEHEALKNMLFLNEGLVDLDTPEYNIIPTNLAALKNTTYSLLQPWVSDYGVTQLIGSTPRQDIEAVTDVYDILGIEMTPEEVKQTEVSVNENVVNGVIGANKMLVEFAGINKGMAITGLTTRLAAISNALTKGKWVKNGKTISNATMEARASKAGISVDKYAAGLNKGNKLKNLKAAKEGYQGYKFIPATNTTKAIDVLQAGLLEGAKFELFTQFDVLKGEFKPEAGERYGFAEGFGFGMAGRILAPLSPLLQRQGKLKDIDFKVPLTNIKRGINSRKLFETFVTAPASFVTGSTVGGIMDNLVQDALGNSSFKNFIDEKYGDHGDLGKELITEYFIGLGFGGMHFKGFNDFKSKAGLKRGREKSKDNMRNLLLKNDFTVEQANNMFSESTMNEVGLKLNPEKLSEFYGHHEMFDMFHRRVQDVYRSEGYLDPARADEMVKKDHKQFLKEQADAGIDVSIEVVNNNKLKFGQEPIDANKRADIKGNKIRYNAERYSPDVMVHEVHHFFTENLFGKDVVFKADFMEQLNTTASKVKLSRLITESEAKELGSEALVGKKMDLSQAIKLEQFDIANPRRNTKIAQWELFAHIAEQIGNKNNYLDIKSSEGFEGLKTLLATLSKRSGKKLNLSTQGDVVEWFSKYSENVKKGRSVVELFSELKEVVDVEATRINKEQRELFGEESATTLESRDLVKEKQELIEVNKRLFKDQPDGWREKTQDNAAKVKVLNNNIEISERNAKNIKRYKEGEPGEPLREAAASQLLKDNTPIIETWFKKNFKKGLDVSESDFRSSMMEGVVRIFNSYDIKKGVPFGYYFADRLRPQLGNILRRAQAGRTTDIAMNEMSLSVGGLEIADTSPELSRSGPEGPKGRKLVRDLNIPEDVISKVEERLTDLDISQLTYKTLKDLAPEYTNEILGVEPKSGNLGKESVANAQKWFSKDSNARLFIDALPEGTIPMEGAPELVKGTSTGVQNTLLKEFYNSGGRVKTKAGAVIQNKIKGITPRQVKDYFGIKTDGTFVELKNDRALGQKVKAAVDQIGKAWTNQVVRESLKNNPEYNISTSLENRLNQIQAGKSKSLASKDLTKDIIKEVKRIDWEKDLEAGPKFRQFIESNDKYVDFLKSTGGVNEFFKELETNVTGLDLKTFTKFAKSKRVLDILDTQVFTPELFDGGFKGQKGKRGVHDALFEYADSQGIPRELLNINEAASKRMADVEFSEKFELEFLPEFLATFDSNLLKSNPRLFRTTSGEGNQRFGHKPMTDKIKDGKVVGKRRLIFNAEAGKVLLSKTTGVKEKLSFNPKYVKANDNGVFKKKLNTHLLPDAMPTTAKGKAEVANKIKEYLSPDGTVSGYEKMLVANEGMLEYTAGKIFDYLAKAKTVGDKAKAINNISYLLQIQTNLGNGIFRGLATHNSVSLKKGVKTHSEHDLQLANFTGNLLIKALGSNSKASFIKKFKPMIKAYKQSIIEKSLQEKFDSKEYGGNTGYDFKFTTDAGKFPWMREAIVAETTLNLKSGKTYDQLLTDVITGGKAIESLKAREKAKDKILKDVGLASKDLSPTEKDLLIKTVDKAFDLGRKKKKKAKGMSTFDFDETVGISDNYVIAKKGKETKRISSAEWPFQGDKMIKEGWEMDFSDFDKVTDGKPGPLMQKMKNQIKKYGPENVFILTARGPESKYAIHEYLKSEGIEISLDNITGLGKSQGEAKAQWMLEKFAEGYNDMYFVDDALPNVEAVKKVLDQLDIKSKVQLALASKDLNMGVNDIMKHSLDIAPEKTFSKAEAKIRGANIKRRRIFMTDAAADLELLLEPLYGKGNKGTENKKWFGENFVRLFERGHNDINNARQKAANGYMALRKQNKKVVKSLDQPVEGTSFTTDMALRTYIWNKNGMKIPGLAKASEAKLVEHVRNNHELQAFAENVARLTGIETGLREPSGNWWAETIASEMGSLGEGVGRERYLQDWMDAKNEIFSEDNLNKMETKLGSDWRENLEEMFYRMETGKTRRADLGKAGNAMMNYLNGSVGTIMSLNTRSAALQLISSVNFINHDFNNPLLAAKAFANQKQYWKDFAYILNSDMLKQRRSGLQINVTEAELAAAASGQKNKAKAVLAWILKQGYVPTKVCDSFAIASGGSTYYRNAINKYAKEGLSKVDAEKRAWIDFQAVAERTQQSSRPDLLSAQQVSVGGRIILPFANTPMQMNRIMMKELLDIKNGRYKGFTGDNSITNKMSKVGYYGFVQSAIFAGLQSGLFALMMNSDDGELIANKKVRSVNTIADSFLRGMGIQGAVLSGLKNSILEFKKQNDKGWGSDYDEVYEDLLNISPTVGSKVGKLDASGNTYKWNKKEILSEGLTLDGPALESLTMGVEALLNIPVNRVHRKIGNIIEALDSKNEAWQRVMVGLGWSQWDVGIGQRKKAEEKVTKDEAKKVEKEQEKVAAKKQVEEEKKAEEQKKKDEGFKNVRCSGTKSNGERCSITIETKAKSAKCTYHKSYKPNEGSDRNNNGVKEYQCKSLTGSGKRCKNRSENANKKCYAHQ